ncbi:MAG: asparagine synthase (glutamine-hydrolyzing) [Schleiferiaceae bacterium]
MCGILGQRSSILDQDRFSQALSLIEHRGPDNTGMERVAGDCLLGHTRLSIIDTSALGNQPMALRDDGVTVVFNGEIYNYQELQEDLKKEGVKFYSHSDTEVILQLYKRKGPQFVNALRGIFAIGIYDQQSEKLYVYRDRLGVKPLYFYNRNGEFAFSSEVKSIKSLFPNISLNMNAIASFLRLGSVASPSSVFNEIEMVEPGHYLEVDKNNSVVATRYYFQDYTPNSLSYEENVAQVREGVMDAVKSRMVSDLPVGAFLSGGIDSSIVVAAMRKHSNQNLSTFSIDFSEGSFSEGSIAQLVANRYETNHHREVVTSDDFKKEFFNILNSIDSPTVDGVNTYFVSKFTKEQGITVALTGNGGDEIFGGYPSFEHYQKLLSVQSKIPGGLRSLIGSFSNLPLSDRYRKLFDFMGSKGNPQVNSYFAVRGMINPSLLKELVTFDFQESYISDLQSQFNDCDFYSFENEVSYLESNAYMLNQLLRDSDNMSMKHALELRVPLLDQKLVSTVNQIPGKYKHGKRLLIDAFSADLPEEVYNRKKQGFTFPFEVWMRGEMANEVKELFFLPNTLLNPKVLDKMWKDFMNKKLSWSRIWTVVVLNYYLKHNLDL